MIVIFMVPVFVNALMFIEGGNVAGDEKTWIGFLGSFIGAVVGGIISGVLTLYGVILTIQRQREIDFGYRYPKMALHGKKIKDQMEEFQVRLNNYFLKEKTYRHIRNKSISIQKKSDQLLEWSAEISGEAFINVNSFLQLLSQLEYKLKEANGIEDDEESSLAIDRVMKEYKSSVNEILKTHSKIMNTLANQYYKDKIF